MKCYNCSQGEYTPQVMPYLEEIGEFTITIPKVAMLVCPLCGDSLMSMQEGRRRDKEILKKLVSLNTSSVKVLERIRKLKKYFNLD